MSKVSILIPCYNVEAFLPQCLDSILNQTYRNLQVVLIDDGSKDNTFAVVQEYARKDSRIEAFHQENQGVATTRNNLLDKVKGDYVLFVDADDWIEPNMISILVNHATSSDSEMVMCDKVMNDGNTEVPFIKTFVLNRNQAIEDFLHHDYFVGSLWNKLISVRLIEGVSFHKDIWYGEDALFCWDVLQKVQSVFVTNERLYHYRQNTDGITYQSFGYKKLTGHKTWQILCKEVDEKYPIHHNLVYGVSARSDMYLLQAASQSGYVYDKNIEELQRSIRKNYCYLKEVLRNDKKRMIYATIIMYCYGFGKLYENLYIIRKSLLSYNCKK